MLGAKIGGYLSVGFGVAESWAPDIVSTSKCFFAMSARTRSYGNARCGGVSWARCRLEPSMRSTKYGPESKAGAKCSFFDHPRYTPAPVTRNESINVRSMELEQALIITTLSFVKLMYLSTNR